MWRPTVRQITDVSDEHAAFIASFEEWAKQVSRLKQAATKMYGVTSHNVVQ
jgi:hypothetical protein